MLVHFFHALVTLYGKDSPATKQDKKDSVSKAATKDQVVFVTVRFLCLLKTKYQIDSVFELRQVNTYSAATEVKSIVLHLH